MLIWAGRSLCWRDEHLVMYSCQPATPNGMLGHGRRAAKNQGKIPCSLLKVSLNSPRYITMRRSSCLQPRSPHGPFAGKIQLYMQSKVQ